MTQRARSASSGMRKQIRPSWKVRFGAHAAQRWARHQLEEHAVPLGLGALTVGVLAAALLPISTSGERQAPSESSTRQPRREAHARGKPQSREAASTKTEANDERPRDAGRRQGASRPRKPSSRRESSSGSVESS
ncbi:hypothetical protein LY474_20130 [Myxococcus stipitatus]|uniref:hypothetical protein n=1 Tax=Myxococcus stipitatus TaxID=83455 RepID=UPI001F3D9350|nr:hypothetical protein [Myxococcus stipitatus]MCE9670110.1 hypothetical protein [Myxococcus stipitatus]